MILLTSTSDKIQVITGNDTFHVVQKQLGANNNSTSIQVTLPNNVAAGNFYFIGVVFANQNATHRQVSSITTSIGGDTVTLRSEFADLTGGTSGRVAYVENSAGGACTITVNFTSTAASSIVVVAEISGVKSSSSFDVDIPGATGSSTTVTSGSFSTNGNPEFGLYIVGDMSNGQTFSASGSASIVTQFISGSTSAGLLDIDYTTTQSSVTTAATYTVSASTPVIVGAVFKSAAILDVHADWADYNGTTVTPGRTNTKITAVATTDIVASPASSTQRGVKSLLLRCLSQDTSYAGETITLQHTDGTTVATLIKVTLTAGQALHYDEENGFWVFDLNNSTVNSPANMYQILDVSVITTTGSSNWISGPRTNNIRLRMLGGGGGGGGTSSATSTGGAAGGGSAGGYLEKFVAVSPSTAYAVVVGTGGGGGSAGANDGSTGNQSTIVISGTTYTATFGNGGKGCTAGTSVVTLGGAASSLPTNGDLNIPGAPGQPGIVLSAAVPMSGAGASSVFNFGAGGAGKNATAAGNNALGYGSGGGGACEISNGGSKAGGNGAQGIIIIEEFS